MEKEETAKLKEEIRAALETLQTGVKGAVLIVLDGDGRLLTETTTRTKKIAAALAREAAYTMHQHASHPMPEHLKIANLEEMLATVAEEEREEIRAQVLSMFTGPVADSGARAVQSLGPGEPLICHGCSEPLKRIATPSFVHPEMTPSEHYECTGCFGSFEREAKVDA